jgi:guanine deaminase
VGLSDRIGNFAVGKDFDALLIDPQSAQSPFDTFAADSARDVFHKFLFCGDDRNMTAIYVAGKCVKKL